MIAYVFPGQGSQRKGMGEGLFEEFQDLTRQADEVLGYSIKELCLADPEQKLNQTQFTQPALYTVNALSYLKKIQDGGRRPDFLAGHSLGEYAALFAAGVFPFATGLQLVKKRGELMSKASKGAMAAIINASESQIKDILADAGLAGIDIANFNSPSQIIISGLKDEVAAAQAHFEKANAQFIPLNTSGAFHSRHMKESAAKFEKFVAKQEFADPGIPVIANVTARPYEPGRIAQNLVDQISSSVRWTDSVRYLLDQGVAEFEEMGIGEVLTKLIGSIRRERKSAAKAAETPLATPAPEPAGTAAAARIPGEAPGAQALVDDWNRNHAVGSKATSPHYAEELETRTPAQVLFGHRAAVYMKGYNGYFDLTELTPVLGQQLQGR